MSGLGFCHVSVPSDAGTDLDARSYRVYTCGALLEGAGDGVPREQGSGPSHPITRVVEHLQLAAGHHAIEEPSSVWPRDPQCGQSDERRPPARGR